MNEHNLQWWIDKISPVLENTPYEIIENPTKSEKCDIVVSKGTTRPHLMAIKPGAAGSYALWVKKRYYEVAKSQLDDKPFNEKSGFVFFRDIVEEDLAVKLASVIAGKSEKEHETWVISGNPSKFDFVSAFRNLRKIDWRQSSNINAGDTVYLYGSDSIQALKFKCAVDDVNKTTSDIDDSEYDLSGEFDSNEGRFMELEMISELNGSIFSRGNLEKHGFKVPQSQIHISEELQKYLSFVEKLQATEEMDPDKHDGTYELMRETIRAYKNSDNESDWDYHDLNLIYLMTVGTWRQGVESKKSNVKDSHLIDEEKTRLINLLDVIWDRSEKAYYDNRENDVTSFGMFGTGFFSFKTKATNEYLRPFIRMCIDIADMDDDEKIFDRCEPVLVPEFRGMTSASSSMVLHCLKPFTFPIFNSNMGKTNIYDYLGAGIKRATEIGEYIPNCRIVKAFRDDNFRFKNYRILDMAAWALDSKEEDEWIPTLKEYDPGLSANDYYEVFADHDKSHNSLDTVLKLYDIGGSASCKQLAANYGESVMHYNSNGVHLAKSVHKCTDCPLHVDGNGKTEYWPILFQGRDAQDGDSGVWIWKLREPVREAIERMLDEGLIEQGIEENTEMTTLDKNMILYGPPGTGKTYQSAIYAVSICDNKPMNELEDYDLVMERYNELKEEGRIAFTTFHQSYGYEEFIEGIKPRFDDEDSNLDYVIQDGVFKAFCEAASRPSQAQVTDLGLNKAPVIWKVSLGGTYENPVRTECLDGGHIRIGWDQYGPDITDETDYSIGGKSVINSFINRMKIGDIILSCYNASTIDAIGVVTGEYRWCGDDYDHYKRVRDVNWIVKDIKEDITEANNGAQMTLSTVYQMKVPLQYVLELIDKYNGTSTPTAIDDEAENYVFIIDEINRGNISKIFGELITLIEATKRLGGPEAMSVTLPYSNSDFGVPNNVYILGTMNTADRSIALMDTALRRRFSFIESMPDSDVLIKLGANTVEADGKTLDVANMLDVINARIACLYDREHTIGHAFFTSLKNNPSIDALSRIFEKSIIPLLQEYFYEDYEKIQLVLGDNDKESPDIKFIVDEKIDAKDVFKGSIEDVDIPDILYSINKKALSNIESYIQIV